MEGWQEHESKEAKSGDPKNFKLCGDLETNLQLLF